jgi:hypothetical protein
VVTWVVHKEGVESEGFVPVGQRIGARFMDNAKVAIIRGACEKLDSRRRILEGYGERGEGGGEGQVVVNEVMSAAVQGIRGDEGEWRPLWRFAVYFDLDPAEVLGRQKQACFPETPPKTFQIRA